MFHLADTKGGRLSQVSDSAVEEVLEGGRALVADLVSHRKLVITLALHGGKSTLKCGVPLKIPKHSFLQVRGFF